MTEVKGVAASQERVVVEASHLEGGDGTVLTGLRLWSASNTAVTYNRWQSLFFALIRDFKLTDTEAQPGESLCTHGPQMPGGTLSPRDAEPMAVAG